MTIDKNVKNRKIDRLLADLKYLETVRLRDKKDFLGNFEAILATREAIMEASQVCVDIAFHVCARNKYQAPTSYRNAFEILAENTILDSELATKMARWAGLRNVIIHVYERVDDSLLFDIIQEDLGDFDRFLRAIEPLLEA